MRYKRIFKIFKILILCLVILVIIVALVVIGVMTLLESDLNHEFLKERMDVFFKGARHFKGELWFSAEVTLVGAVISAIPGLCCGVLALVQSHMLHDLESRYHRPSMELQKASLLFIRTEDVKEVSKSPNIDSALSFKLTKIDHVKNKVFINLKFDFVVKNDITIKEIYIQKVTFNLPSRLGKEKPETFNLKIRSKDWQIGQHDLWDFNRRIKQSQMVYSLSCDLYAAEQLLKKPLENVFWDSIKEFAFYKDKLYEKYKYLTLDIYLKVDFEYREKKDKRSMLKVEFNAEQSKSDISRYVALKESNDGYFTFEIEGKNE